MQLKLPPGPPREGWCMMVTDLLPTGFETINYSLNTGSVVSMHMGQYKYYWLHLDLRDSRAGFFTTYPWKGEQVKTYLLCTTSSGTFRALPEATLRYGPEMLGGTARAEFAVKS